MDDEDSILRLGAQILSNFGYTVLTAPDGESALDLYREEEEHIDLIILDLIMPGMGGTQCLEELMKINPRARVLIASGHFPDESTEMILKTNAKGFITKPYELREMLKRIRETLDGDPGDHRSGTG